ncbi:Inter-alpha-trypsin inhibitor heavy chain H4 [Frankliniella fusca]|uniref:Inter-alpha-trypsin inhibitor heavy chain H4 n=1 Tax=Frankliniella fusca TaxID=407009 RepID=A0AAE1HSK9_9NEOP|nr:Inter-alpha-trypsin inhibitor heavy chain H4 [Frankliniella fusca]
MAVSTAPGALALRVALALLLAFSCCAPPSAGFPRPDEDAAMVVTSTTATPALAPSPLPAVASGGATEPPQQQQQSPPAPQVRSLHVNSTVQYRYAHTVVSSRVANPANISQEVTFSVVLPETAFISSFAMEVDGKIYKAYVKEKAEAKQTYDAAVAAGQSAAHVAVSARDSNSFTVSLNVEDRNKVSFNLTYEELLTRKLGLYDHVITLNPGQVVQDLQVLVHIKENKNITKLRVPEFSSGNKIDADLQECDDITQAKPTKCASGNNLAAITWKSPSEVEVLFRPSAAEQDEIRARLEEKKKKALEEAGGRLGVRHNSMLWSDVFQPSDDDSRGDKKQDGGLNGQFSVQYDVDRDANGGEVVVNDGYFVHFFSPTELKPLKKHAIFVLDVSGSMDGRKIEQLREAMMSILDDLKDGDYFNLISFSSDVKVWNLDKPDKSALYTTSEGVYYGSESTTTEAPQQRPPAYRATKDNIAKAKEVVKALSAYGGTNINDALKTALKCARDGARSAALSDSDQTLEPIVLFLTDGDPTVGLTVPARITSGISELNLKPRSAVFSLAFGDEADIRFLRKLSLANGGFARTIYEAADASLQLKNFYRQISSPLLANVSFSYISDKVERDSMTQLQFRTLFDGTELVVAGRTADKGVQEVGGSIQATADGGKRASFNPHVVTIDEPLTIYPFDVEGPLFNATAHQSPKHVSVLERLWAYLTIKQLLDEQDALDAKTFKEEVVEPPTRVRPLPVPPQPEPPLALPAMAVSVAPSSTDSPSTSSAAPAVAELEGLDLSVLKPEPKKRALELALKYSFVTPLTSLVVVKPNETKTTDAQTVNPGFADRIGYGGAVYAAAIVGGPPPGLAGPVYSQSSLLTFGSSGGAAPMLFEPPRAPPPPPPPSQSADAWTVDPAAELAMLGADELDPVSHMLATTTTKRVLAAPPSLGALGRPVAHFSKKNYMLMNRIRPSPALLGVYSTTVHSSTPLTEPMTTETRAPLLGNKFSALSMAEAEEAEEVDASQVDRVDVNTTSNFLVNISEVKWLPSDALQKGVLPLKINGTEKNYKVSNETELSPTQSCDLPDASAPGVCRHLANCVLQQVVQRIEDFVKYQCSMGDYLAICCPSDVIQIDSVQTTLSPKP